MARPYGPNRREQRRRAAPLGLGKRARRQSHRYQNRRHPGLAETGRRLEAVGACGMEAAAAGIAPAGPRRACAGGSTGPKSALAMSLRAELVRLGARLFLKPGNSHPLAIAPPRDLTRRCERWAPMPPADTEMVRGQLGGIAALRVATPRSRADRHILFLHGGGYVAGSPELYRHIFWRVASAADARVAAIDYRLPPPHPLPPAPAAAGA